MIRTGPFRAAIALFALGVCAIPAPTQETVLAYRDFGALLRMRVVCSKAHFGRLRDLVVTVPSGKITGAVIAMPEEGGTVERLVPFEKLAYDAQANLMRLGTCLEHDHEFPAFDADAVRIGVDDEGALVGLSLLSRLARSQVALEGEGRATVHEASVELTSGHLAFLDVAKGTERAGDGERHPIPWSIARFAIEDADEGRTPLLTLPLDVQALEAAPSLIAIIVQDPNYRALVYKHFGIARPDYDTESL